MPAIFAAQLGPLTWVKPEIDCALQRTRTCLNQYADAPEGDDSAACGALASMREVTGALQIIGMDALGSLSLEVEKLLEISATRTAMSPTALKELVTSATNAIGQYLAHVMAGQPENAMGLLPLMKQLAQLRGGEPVDEQSLFRPNLDMCPPPHPAGAHLVGEALFALVRAQRSRYQRGMLSWLRQSEDGLELMRDALQELERARPDPRDRAPWWVAAAFVEGLLYGGLARTDAMKRLAGKIDRHLAAFLSGVPENAALLREMLFHLTRCEAVSPLVRDVKALYRLDRYRDSSTATGISLGDAEGSCAILRDIQQALSGARTAWASIKPGDKDAPPGFCDRVTLLRSLSKELRNDTLTEFANTLLGVAAEFGARNAGSKERLEIEVGVALLASEQAVEALRFPTAQTSERFDSIRSRLLSAAGPDATAAERDRQTSLADREQQPEDAELVSQVAREMLSNLQQVEQVLDGYFRGQSVEQSREPINALLRSVSGALRMLGMEPPAQLIDQCALIVDALPEAKDYAPEAETALLADGLSSVMLYIQAIDRGYDEELAAVEEILARFHALRAYAMAPLDEQLQTVADDPESHDASRIDLNVLAEQEDSTALSLDFNTSAHQSDTEDVTPAELAAIVDRFDLSALKDDETDAPVLSGNDASTGARLPGLLDAAGFIDSQSGAPSTQDDQIVIDLGAPGVDPEIVSFFIEEATEILARTSDLIARLRLHPGSKEELLDLRRSFHTLKGSGRMAGLPAIGDAAWTIEALLNAWLERDKPASEALVNLAGAGHAMFAGWIGDLAQNGRAIARTDELNVLARIVAGDLAESTDPTSIASGVASTTPRVEAEAGASVANPSTAAAPEVANTGHQVFSAPLFDIFLEEARQHVGSLRGNLIVTSSCADEGTREAFIRAAHTLGGIARAAGFPDISLVAGIVEDAPLATADRGKLLRLTTAAVDALETMLATVAAGRVPLLGEEHRTALLDGAAQLEDQGDSHVSAAAQSGVDTPTAADDGHQIEETPAPELSSVERIELREVDLEPEAETAIASVPQPPQEQDQRATSGVQLRDTAERRLIKDDIDEQLLPVFLEEVRELVPMVGETLRKLRNEPDDAAAAASLRRMLHTIKGGARMVGAIRLGELVHVMEERIETAAEQSAVTGELLDTLEAEFDRLTGGFDALGQVASDREPEPAVAKAQGATSAAYLKWIAPDGKSAEQSPHFEVHTRVAADALDRLVGQAGEIGISRGRIDAESQRFKQFVLELTDSVARLRGQLREIEIHAESRMQATLNQASDHQTVFDPLEFDRFTRFQELTRLMAESVHDVTTVQQDLLESLDEVQAALGSQSRLNRSLQDDLMRLRTVPFQSLGERLHRLVRQVARDACKKASLEVIGAQTGVDRGLLERMAAPLEHLVRNAITHGIEASDRRLIAGKPEIGELRLTLRQEARYLQISLSDDGCGIDHCRVRDKAVELGWIAADAEPTHAELEQMILRAGFSTAAEVSELAGRGIGMDVVANEVTALGGNLEVSTESGRGTTFSIRVPLTVAVAKGVLVTAKGRRWSILASLVEHVQEVSANGLPELWTRRQLDWMGRRYPLFYFPELVGEKLAPTADRPRYFALLIRSGDRGVAVLVDQVTVNHELVLKKIGPQLAQLPGMSGATVMSDGEVVLILNPVSLAAGIEQVQVCVEAKAEDRATSAPLVMVVDDSLTVRNVTSRLLTRNGYRVATARDGLDALQQIQETTPDVLLADIEMPRMDGFDLTKNCKASPRTASIPIIMITSRLAPKHRDYAEQLGVNAYLGKPYEEAELLAHIARFTASTAAA